MGLLGPLFRTILGGMLLLALTCGAWEVYRPMGDEIEKLELSDGEWRERLTESEFHVLR